MSADESWRTAPVDERSRVALAGRGLDYRTVAAGSEAFPGWLAGVARGFQDGEPSATQLAAARTRNTARRLTGVFDPSADAFDAPDPSRSDAVGSDGVGSVAVGSVAVGSIASWLGELTVPGGSIPAAAISAVTVAQTHRRRGIARALLEGELRLAAAAGLPLAMLTVTESTLYGRYGFASAASAAIIDIDTRRVSWSGPQPAGRVDYVSRTQARDALPGLHEAARRRTPGDVTLPGGFANRFTATDPDATDAGAVRCVLYRDDTGAEQGVLAYTIALDDRDRVKGTAKIVALVAATDDAYAALWRFVLELDLVTRVHAELCSVDEPVLWMIGDRRAASVAVFDHQYLRILDVPAALGARTYAAPGRLVLEVTDPLGIAGGRYVLEVDDAGVATVAELDAARSADAAADAVSVTLSTAELSALYLGGVPAVALARAGRIETDDPETVGRILGWPVTPRLSIWY